ncbi:MAG: hypothetical protein LBF49_02100 [Puniceicoccales bacterium]|nr:hypothetical protein [Puniceicoccales bacterium]
MKGAIGKAFFGKTDGIDDGEWAGVRTRLKNRTLRQEARGIWQMIVNEVAADCFDVDGKVDVGKLKTWIDSLRNAETFKQKPFCSISLAELMRSQMYRVCERFAFNRNGVRALDRI